MGGKRVFVLVLLTALLIVFGVSLALRDHTSVTSSETQTAESTSASAPQPAKQGPVATPDTVSETEAGKQAPVMEGPPLDRTLRTIAFGWDLLAPGQLGKQQPATREGSFASTALEVSFRATTDLGEVKAALARGGADNDGADIAIIPLPEMVAAYEDLRALKPQIFFIVGWSRGRDATYGLGSRTLLKPRKNKKPVKLLGDAGHASTLLSLYMLDLAGVPPGQVQLVTEAEHADFVAVDRADEDTLPKGSRILVTTADARLLIPYVAIAPSGFLQNDRATRAWLAGWLAGVAELQGDVPAAARKVAAIKDGPETIDLVRKLGQIDFAGLDDNVRRAGLSGRDAVTLDELFKLTWQLWRSAGAISTPTPRHAPFSGDALSSLVLGSKTKPTPVPVLTEYDFTTTPLLRIRLEANGNEDARARSLRRIALVSGVFAHSALRLGSRRSKAATTNEVDTLTSRFGLAAPRFQANHRLSKNNSMTLEVLSAP